MEEFAVNKVKLVNVRISRSKQKGKWIIRIHGVTSGFVVHTESDDSTIEFSYDASRFDPRIELI